MIKIRCIMKSDRHCGKMIIWHGLSIKIENFPVTPIASKLLLLKAIKQMFNNNCGS